MEWTNIATFGIRYAVINVAKETFLALLFIQEITGTNNVTLPGLKIRPLRSYNNANLRD